MQSLNITQMQKKTYTHLYVAEEVDCCHSSGSTCSKVSVITGSFSLHTFYLFLERFLKQVCNHSLCAATMNCFTVYIIILKKLK